MHLKGKNSLSIYSVKSFVSYIHEHVKIDMKAGHAIIPPPQKKEIQIDYRIHHLMALDGMAGLQI